MPRSGHGVDDGRRPALGIQVLDLIGPLTFRPRPMEALSRRWPCRRMVILGIARLTGMYHVPFGACDDPRAMMTMRLPVDLSNVAVFQVVTASQLGHDHHSSSEVYVFGEGPGLGRRLM